MKWITRERPKIDRIACPWLIKNFVDAGAEFIYVPKGHVFDKAKELDAIPYDIPGAEYSHYGEACTFDYIVKKHGITDKAVLQLALIIRGADTDSFHLAPQAAGLWAISAGLSYNFKDDHEMLAIGMKVYDALYSWARYVQEERHSWTEDKKPLTLKELKTLIAVNDPKLKLIDIRTAEEYNKLHIPGAKNIPVELLIDASAFFKKDDLLICVCNKGHERSQDAAALLFSKGFEHSFYLEGGTVAWFDAEK